MRTPGVVRTDSEGDRIDARRARAARIERLRSRSPRTIHTLRYASNRHAPHRRVRKRRLTLDTMECTSLTECPRCGDSAEWLEFTSRCTDANVFQCRECG